MLRMQRLSVRSKVIGASAIYVALCVGLGLFALHQATRINASAQEIRDNWLPSTVRLGQLSHALSELRLHQFGAGAHLSVDYEKWPADEKLVAEAMQNVQTALEAYKPYIVRGTLDATLMDEFATVWTSIGTVTGRFRTMARDGDIFGAIGVIDGEAKGLLAKAKEIVRKDLQFKEEEGRNAANRSAAVYDFAFKLVLLAVALAALMGVAISIGLNMAIVTPLRRATEVVGDLTKGDLNVQITDVKRGDEFGTLAKALEYFRTSLIGSKREMEAAELARAQTEADHRRARDEAIEAERNLVATSIGSGLAKLASKDLSYRLTENLPAAYAQLQTDFNRALEQLEGSLQAIGATSSSMAQTSEKLSLSTDGLSRRTGQQAASLEETAAAVEEITCTGKKAAAGAEHARKAMSEAKADAEAAGVVVRKTVDAIGNIEKSSAQIGQIIGVINEIAFQTNLLALNAGVEAARAGDAGRGFAVVASEVRALAQRSANAAKEIRALISNSSTQVSEGVNLVAQTGKALERILAQVDNINGIVVEIAAGAQEQATGLEQVNTAINEMDRTTQENAAVVEDTTAGSTSLAGEAQRMVDLIAEFQVRSQDASVGPAERRVANISTARSGRPRAVPVRAVAAGGAGPARAAADQGWEEF